MNCNSNGGYYLAPPADPPVVLLDVVSTVPMETGMVTMDAAAMAKDIDAMGHIALYGIYFDSDKSDVNPARNPIASSSRIARAMSFELPYRVTVRSGDPRGRTGRARTAPSVGFSMIEKYAAGTRKSPQM